MVCNALWCLKAQSRPKASRQTRPSRQLNTAVLTKWSLACLKMKQQKGETPPEGGEVAGDKYISPVFSFDEEEHRELISAANNVDLVLKGERGHDVRVSSSRRSSTQHSTECCTQQCVCSEQKPPLCQPCMLQGRMLLAGSMCFAHVCSPAANARGRTPPHMHMHSCPC